MTNEKDLAYYMQLPYEIEIVPEEDGTGYNAEIPDLEGCMAFGDTIEDAIATLEDIKETWFELALQRGWAIPEPVSDEIREFSGRFNVRLPRSLHWKLARLAEVQGTSLNQMVLTLLAEGAQRWAARQEFGTPRHAGRQQVRTWTNQEMAETMRMIWVGRRRAVASRVIRWPEPVVGGSPYLGTLQ